MSAIGHMAEIATQAALTALKATPEWQAREQRMERVRELARGVKRLNELGLDFRPELDDLLAALDAAPRFFLK